MRVIRPTTAAAAVASLLLHCSPPHPRAPPPRLTFDADEIRIVCVSDTHGFEGQLPPVPPGDLLIHCGDFAPDGGSTVRLRAVEAFDQWLAAQPHKVKLVIRGNHDPTECDLPCLGCHVHLQADVGAGGLAGRAFGAVHPVAACASPSRRATC